jgi:hypothetical protein
MVYRSVRPQPPRGSTAWGAQQFSRVLDDEERIAAERERLRALGWRPPQVAAGAYADEPAFGDERDAYADMVQQQLDARRALEDEARRRAGVRLGESGTTPETRIGLVSTPASAPGWTGGGRFGVPVPGRLSTASRGLDGLPIDGETPGLQFVTDKPSNASNLAAAFVNVTLALAAAEFFVPKTREEWESHQRRIQDLHFLYQRLTHQMAQQFSPEEIAKIEESARKTLGTLPPEVLEPPQGLDPETEERLTQPLPGYPDSSGELERYGRPPEPVPVPDHLTNPRPPQPDPLPELSDEPLVRITLPQILDKFWAAGILLRGESASTRQDNDDIIKMAQDTMASCGWKADHIGGGPKTERHLRNDDYKGTTKGDRFVDGSIKGTAPDGREVLYDFNTAKRLVDGRWVAYERRAKEAILLLKGKLDKLRTRFDVYPKSRGMDRETWRESVRPYVQEAVRALLDC